MLEEGWHVIWINWTSFLGLVLEPHNPMHEEIFPAHIIFCEIDMKEDLQ
jgi:hypothetical protein